MANKVCCKCQELKPKNEFHKNKAKKDGLSTYCKACNKNVALTFRQENPDKDQQYHRRYKLQSLYGLTIADYEALLISQGGACAICGSASACTNKDNLYVDHCHQTGVVRGLLCQRCNSAIGLMRDNPELCRKAVEYLEASCPIMVQ